MDSKVRDGNELEKDLFVIIISNLLSSIQKGIVIQILKQARVYPVLYVNLCFPY